MGTHLPIELQPDTLAAGDLRSNFKSVIEDVKRHPGRVLRFGRHRQAEVVVMSNETLRSIFDQLARLERDLLVERSQRIVDQGYDPVDPEEIEGAALLTEARRIAGTA